MRIIETQLEALVLLADWHSERAVERLKDAVAAEDCLATGYGPPLPVKLSTELLGEVLLNLARWKEAQSVFQQSLQRTPRRTASLVGFAHAARNAGDIASAKRTNHTLSDILEQKIPYRGGLNCHSAISAGTGQEPPRRLEDGLTTTTLRPISGQSKENHELPSAAYRPQPN